MVNPSGSSAFDFHDNILAISFSVNGFEIKSNIHCLQTFMSVVFNSIFLTKELFVAKANCSLVGSLTNLLIFSCAKNLSIFCSFFSLNNAHINHYTQFSARH